MKLSFSILVTLLFSILIINSTNAQYYLSVDQGIYGGTIRGITGGLVNESDTTVARFFVATVNVNNAFYFDVTKTSSGVEFSKAKVVPGLSGDFTFSHEIHDMGYHAKSGNLFYLPNFDVVSTNHLYRTNPITNIASDVIPLGVFDFKIIGNNLFALAKGKLYFGKLDTNGVYSNATGSPMTLAAFNLGYDGDRPHFPRVIFSRKDSTIYLFKRGQTPRLFVCSSHYDSLNASTTFSEIDLTPITATVDWQICGVGYDGRLFLGGRAATTDVIAYTDNRTNWTSISRNNAVGNSACFDFLPYNNTYYVYTSAYYNSNKGQAEWKSFGTPGGLPANTSTNGEGVLAFPRFPGFVLLELSGSFGYSTDYGQSFSEFIDGLEATDVNCLSLFNNDHSGWLATGAGLRIVSNNNTPNARWTRPNLPVVSYSSVSVDPVDTNIVYFGKNDVCKTTDGGDSYTSVFTTMQEPFNFGYSGNATSVEICPYDHNIVFAGYNMAYYPNTVNAKGGLFYTADANNIFSETWHQLPITISQYGYDANIGDILFNKEGNDTVLYVSAIYDPANPLSGKNIYRIVKSGSNWTVSSDMVPANMEDHSTVTASIQDLELSANKQIIYAAGFDEYNHTFAVYKKDLAGSGKWSLLTTNGLPINGFSTRIAAGNDTVFFSVDNRIYFLGANSSAWGVAHTYPEGTSINFLLFDGLVAGTSTGFYAFVANPNVGVKQPTVLPRFFKLEQNYPNPFNPSTKIKFSLPHNDRVTLKVYDILGREVITLIDGYQTAGDHTIEFNGAGLASGIYMYRVSGDNFSETKKMLMLK
jgi:hypothetical protein